MTGYCATCHVKAGPKHRSTRAHLRATSARQVKPARTRHLSVRESEAAQDRYLEESDYAEHGPALFEGDDWAGTTTRQTPPIPSAVWYQVSPRHLRGGVCPRCGQSFRTPNGRAWHDANRPNCAKGRAA